MRTFVECRVGSDEALHRRHIEQEIGNAYDSLASAIQNGDVKKQADESARLDEALIAEQSFVNEPAPPPIQLPPKLNAADRKLVQDAVDLVANPRWRSQPAKTLRALLPMFARYVS